MGGYSEVQPGDCIVAFSRRDIYSIKQYIEQVLLSRAASCFSSISVCPIEPPSSASCMGWAATLGAARHEAPRLDSAVRCVHPTLRRRSTVRVWCMAHCRLRLAASRPSCSTSRTMRTASWWPPMQ